MHGLELWQHPLSKEMAQTSHLDRTHSPAPRSPIVDCNGTTLQSCISSCVGRSDRRHRASLRSQGPFGILKGSLQSLCRRLVHFKALLLRYGCCREEVRRSSVHFFFLNLHSLLRRSWYRFSLLEESTAPQENSAQSPKNRQDCQKFFRAFDRDSDERLSFAEFARGSIAVKRVGTDSLCPLLRLFWTGYLPDRENR